LNQRLERRGERFRRRAPGLEQERHGGLNLWRATTDFSRETVITA
jgi:hypothetical protein